MVIGGQPPAQPRYLDARAAGNGIQEPPQWYLRNPGRVFRKVKILQVGPLVLRLALAGVDSGHGCGDRAVLEPVAGQVPCVRTVRSPAGPRGMMSQILAGGQDYLVSSTAATGEASSAPQEMKLSVQGMTCASCAARVEKKLNTLDGVVATVNFATEVAIVTAPADVAVQQLIDAVEQAGYRAEILDRGPGGVPADGPQAPAERGGDADMVAYLRRRLIVALVLFVPLTDLSVLLSLFPWSRFPGWQWVLLGVAAPVVVWSAWPFHQAALRNARHGSTSMDTLVSLGITAACGWSVYAMFVLDRDQARV